MKFSCYLLIDLALLDWHVFRWLDLSLPQKSEAEPEQFFWREPGENRAKLFPHDLYVSAWDLCYMRRNYGLLTDLPRTMGHAILFGWDLICHMLGGPVVVCRRLKNARSDQEKTAGVLLGADVYQMVLGKSSGIRFSIPEISIYGEKIHFLFNLFKF